MAGITGKNLFLSFGGTVLDTGYRAFSVSEETALVDQSAGADTVRTYLTTLVGGSADAAVLIQAGDTALWDAVGVNVSGTLEWGEEGTADGNQKHTVYAIIQSREKAMEYDDLVVADIEWGFSDVGGVTDGAYTRYYVDATGGDDSDDGLSQATAWQTIAKVNGASFNAGDEILFKRGETWTGTTLTPPSSGTAKNKILFGAYGSGDLPVIDSGSIKQSLYVNGKSHIVLEYLNVIIPWDGVGEGYGIRLNDASNVTIRYCTVDGGDDQDCHALYLVDSPDFYVHDNDISEAYKGMYVYDSSSGHAGTIDNNTISDITKGPGGDPDWDGIRIVGSGDQDFRGLTISNNDISGFVENGIDLNSAANVICEYNYVHDSSDAKAVSDQHGFKVGNSTNGSGNIIRYNHIKNINTDGTNRMGIAALGGNTQIYYNIIEGIGYAGNGSWGIHHSGYPTTGTEIYNNVVVDCLWDAIRIGGQADAEVTATVSNNICEGGNTDLRVYGSDAILNGSNNVLMNDAAPTESEGGTDNTTGNLGATDPLFVTEYTDLHLQSGSPARNAGADVGLVQDYDSVEVPQETNPAIGAYEYVA